MPYHEQNTQLGFKGNTVCNTLWFFGLRLEHTREGNVNRLMILVFLLVFNFHYGRAASRAVFIPVTNQVMVMVQSIDYETGQLDRDPEILWDLLNAPKNSLPGGDEGMILKSNDGSLVLTCVHRVRTGTKQCQFDIKDSVFTKIDRALQRVNYSRESAEAARWYDQVKPNVDDKMIFKTSDGKLEFIATPYWFTLSFAGR